MRISGYQTMKGSFSETQMFQHAKQSLLERKNELVSFAVEHGGNTKSIQDTLESYEEQTKELDQQISKEMFIQNGKEPEEIGSSKKAYKQKTKEEIQQERISGLVDLSSSISQARTVLSSRTQAEGEARVLESEIKTDSGKSGDLEMTAKKEERLAQLQQKSARLASEAARISKKAVDSIRENHEAVSQEAGAEKDRDMEAEPYGEDENS